MKQLKVCSLCQVTGKTGANFVLCTGSEESRVHKYCGDQLVAKAPEGVTTRLVHFGELAREKRQAAAKKEQDRVRDFWAGKFAKASAGKTSTLKVA